MNLSKELIAEKLKTDNRWLTRAILAIYERQTDQEQRSERTIEHNNIGFNGVDAPFLSSLVLFYKEHKYMTLKQLNYARFKMIKYSGQLLRIAEGKL